MALRTFHFTLEALGRCEAHEAEFYLQVAAHALREAGFALDDAQAIGIDGAPGAALRFPDPAVKALRPPTAPNGDTRRLSDVPGHLA